MKYTLALLSVVGAAIAGGVTQVLTPDGSNPPGSADAFDGDMWVSVETVAAAQKRSLVERRSACTEGNLVVSLSNGVLTDSKSRTGYIASNFQFQFDDPPQAGAIYTGGFSLFANGSLALGPTTTFYMCKSGSFWNLYDRSWAAQCEPAQLAAFSCKSTGSGAAGEGGDGQPVATQLVTTTIVKPISDGQPQVLTTVVPVPLCQIGDGQLQAHTTPCASVTPTPSKAPPAPSSSACAPVSQFSDGQIQVTPCASSGVPAPSAPLTASALPPPASPTGTPAPASPVTPSASSPPAGGSTVPVVVSSSTAGTSTISTLSTSAKTTSPPATTTSAPATSNAGRMEMGSVAALVVGLVGVVAFL